jgi:hypothetical protein
MTTVGIFRLFPSLPGYFSTGKSFQVVFRALATVGWLTADFFRGSAIRFSSDNKPSWRSRFAFAKLASASRTRLRRSWSSDRDWTIS